ncbi:MAG: HEAT repeat domain-containing protein [Stenomitos frigidus ULC029]
MICVINSAQVLNAVEAIGMLGYPSETALQTLLNLLNNDRDYHLFLTAIRALGDLGKASEEVVQRLLEMFKKGEDECWSAIYAIRKLNKKADWVESMLADCLTEVGES